MNIQNYIKRNYLFLSLVLFSIGGVIYRYKNMFNNKKEGIALNFFNDKSTETKQLFESINKTVNESFISATQKCQNDLNAEQLINIQCDVPESVQLQLSADRTACANNIVNVLGADATPEQIANYTNACVTKSCEIDNLSQEQVISFAGECSIDQSMLQDMQNEIKNNLQQKKEQSTDGFGGALNALAEGLANSELNIGGSTHTKTEFEERLITEVTNSVSQETMTEMFNSFKASQTMNIEGADLIMKNVAQKMTLDITVGALTKNSFINETVNAIEATVKKEEKEEVKAPFEGILTNPAFLIVAGGVLFIFLLLIIL